MQIYNFSTPVKQTTKIERSMICYHLLQTSTKFSRLWEIITKSM